MTTSRLQSMEMNIQEIKNCIAVEVASLLSLALLMWFIFLMFAFPHPK